VYDPWADAAHVKKECGIEIVNQLPDSKFDAVILAVAHDQFKSLDVKALLKDNGVVYDVKGVLDRDKVDGRL
jgi:UDP-N-acetyl-D-galactosamine dehydrogenase